MRKFTFKTEGKTTLESLTASYNEKESRCIHLTEYMITLLEAGKLCKLWQFRPHKYGLPYQRPWARCKCLNSANIFMGGTVPESQTLQLKARPYKKW